MSTEGVLRKRQNRDEEANVADYGTNENVINDIKNRKQLLNIIRCRRYKDKKKQQNHSKPQTMTIEEEEKIKCRKEQDRRNSQRYRDKKRNNNLTNLHTDQSLKNAMRHISKCKNIQISRPSTRNMPYARPGHTANLSTRNEQSISESHINCNDNNYNDTVSQLNNVPQIYEPIITIYEPNDQNSLLLDVQDNFQSNISSGVGKIRTWHDDNKADVSGNGKDKSQSENQEIKKRKGLQSKIRCQRYRDKKKTDTLITVVNSKHRTITVEKEERIKSRKEYDREKSQRHRYKKRGNHLNNLHTDQSLKKVIRHASQFHKSTEIEPIISESYLNCYDNIHNDTASQFKYVQQIYEPIITIHEPNDQNDKDNQSKMPLNAFSIRQRQDDKEAVDLSDESTRLRKIDDIKKRKQLQNKIRCQRYRYNKKLNTISSKISEHLTITVEEEEKIKRRKEYDKQKSQRYRDRKRANTLFNLSVV